MAAYLIGKVMSVDGHVRSHVPESIKSKIDQRTISHRAERLRSQTRQRSESRPCASRQRHTNEVASKVTSRNSMCWCGNRFHS
jgi:hypothetical protein